MNALILAAGLGSRLGSLTSMTPKCLVKISGIPILQHQLESLEAEGIKNVLIVVGYQKARVKEFLTAFKTNMKVSLLENSIYSETNSAFSFWCARNYVVSHDIIHLNCDVVFSKELLRQLIDHPHENVIAVNSHVSLGTGMEVVEVRNEQIIRMDNKPFQGGSGKAFGLAKFSKEENYANVGRISALLDEGKRNENFYGILRDSIRRTKYLSLQSQKNDLCEINTGTDYVSVQEIFCV